MAHETLSPMRRTPLILYHPSYFKLSHKNIKSAPDNESCNGKGLRETLTNTASDVNMFISGAAS